MENENFNTGGTGANLFAGKGNPTTNGQVRDRHTQYMLYPSVKWFWLKSLQVGVNTNPPEWFQLKTKYSTPEIPQKG